MKQELLIISFSIISSFLFALAGSVESFMIDEIPVIFHCWAIIFGIQIVVFIPSYIFKTERFFDLTGSITFLSIVWYIVYLRSGILPKTAFILAILISVWALRLGLFLFFRVHKDGKDRRFDSLKVDFFKFLRVWMLQGLWVFITSLCAMMVLCSELIVDNNIFINIGVSIWILGFLIEVVSDMQKRQFMKNNKGKFISSGLWGYSRHPNYLGEILLWFGIAIICLPNLEGAQYLGLISPLFVYLLLTRISGINLLEQYADETWGDLESYQHYKKTTPLLFPFKK